MTRRVERVEPRRSAPENGFERGDSTLQPEADTGRGGDSTRIDHRQEAMESTGQLGDLRTGELAVGHDSIVPHQQHQDADRR